MTETTFTPAELSALGPSEITLDGLAHLVSAFRGAEVGGHQSHQESPLRGAQIAPALEARAFGEILGALVVLLHAAQHSPICRSTCGVDDCPHRPGRFHD